MNDCYQIACQGILRLNIRKVSIVRTQIDAPKNGPHKHIDRFYSQVLSSLFLHWIQGKCAIMS